MHFPNTRSTSVFTWSLGLLVSMLYSCNGKYIISFINITDRYLYIFVTFVLNSVRWYLLSVGRKYIYMFMYFYFIFYFTVLSADNFAIPHKLS